MRNLITSKSAGRLAILAAFVVAGLIAPRLASAQDRAANPVLGERYHVEVSGTMWNPTLLGVISSEQFGVAGTDIDFVNNLGYERTRFRDFRLVLRPGKKHRFRFQYTPVLYSADTNLKRDIVFNNVRFAVQVPLASQFSWKVLRAGYEYDFLYKPRGFVGVLFDVRYTQMEAQLRSAVSAPEYSTARAPLPAFGVVGRAYVLPDLALNFEVSGLRLPPNVVPDYEANYADWDINGTVNLNRNVGLQVGWRKMTTYLGIEKDKGDLKFQGMWFGGALRF